MPDCENWDTQEHATLSFSQLLATNILPLMVILFHNPGCGRGTSITSKPHPQRRGNSYKNPNTNTWVCGLQGNEGGMHKVLRQHLLASSPLLKQSNT